MIRPLLAAVLLLAALAARAQSPEPDPPADPAAEAPVPAQVSPARPSGPAPADPPPGPTPPGTTAPAQARPGDPVALPDPSPAPPAPARLNGAPAAPAQTALSWPPGIDLQPNGALRLRVAGNGPDAAQAHAIEAIGRRIAELPAGRVLVEVQVSTHPRDASLARRLALARARAVKDALVAGGLPATRIDLRPLGRLDPPADLVDILPPGARSTTQTR